MTAWASFYPWVLPYCPGIAEPSVDIALRDASREFCRRTRLWVEQAAAVTGDGTTQSFSFVLTSGTELVRVMRATVAGEDMDILSAREMPADWQEDDPDTEALDDTLVVKQDDSGYVLYPVPADGDEIVIYQALQPTVSATSVGDVVYQRYGEAIAKSAAARLLMYPGQTWSNPALAVELTSHFERAIHSAANQYARQARLRSKLSPL